MLDDIREWISDNLRYILLGVAGILVILIVVLAVRLIGGRKSDEKKQNAPAVEDELQTTSEDADTKPQTTQEETGEEPAGTAGDALKRNEPDVLDLVTRYYTAKLNQDYDTLGEICEVMDDSAKAGYEALDAAIESYNNLMTYSKAGLTQGSYVVFAYFDAKLTGFDTLVPTLRGLYLDTNEDGKLIVSDPKNHPDQEAYQEQVWTDDDVQALRKDVAAKYNDSLEQDPELASFVASVQPDQTGNTDTDGTGGNGDDSVDNDGNGASLGTMYATTVVNVRGEPSAESTLYGTVTTGMQVEVLENLDSGWSRIRYNTSDGTIIEGYLMTQYLTSAQ